MILVTSTSTHYLANGTFASFHTLSPLIPYFNVYVPPPDNFEASGKLISFHSALASLFVEFLLHFTAVII